MNNRIKKITFTGVFIALIIGIGYALVFVPNIELITALIFIAGSLMGVKQGVLVGSLGEFLFSALNPMGSGLLFPPMLVAQVISMGLIGMIGGLVSNFILKWKPKPQNILIIGGLGFTLTLFYDFLVSLAYPISAGFTLKATIAAVITGLGFSVVHISANTLIFIILVPITTQTVYRAIPYFSEYK